MYVAKQNAKNCKLIEVFNQNTDIKVGEFYRNYCSFGVETFAPFFREGKWYALYSPSYVAISAMELPSCKHIECEDQNNSFGFCPVEIYIPQYEWSYTPAKSTEELKSNPKPKVKILKSCFDVEPSKLDILYIKFINKMYKVDSVSLNENYYDFNLNVYEKMTTIRPNS